MLFDCFLSRCHALCSRAVHACPFPSRQCRSSRRCSAMFSRGRWPARAPPACRPLWPFPCPWAPGELPRRVIADWGSLGCYDRFHYCGGAGHRRWPQRSARPRPARIRAPRGRGRGADDGGGPGRGSRDLGKDGGPRGGPGQGCCRGTTAAAAGPPPAAVAEGPRRRALAGNGGDAAPVLRADVAWAPRRGLRAKASRLLTAASSMRRGVPRATQQVRGSNRGPSPRVAALRRRRPCGGGFCGRHGRAAGRTVGRHRGSRLVVSRWPEYGGAGHRRWPQRSAVVSVSAREGPLPLFLVSFVPHRAASRCGTGSTAP